MGIDGPAASRGYGGELSCQTAQPRLAFAFRGGFPRGLTGRASRRGRQGLETSLGDVAAALDALPVGAAVELRQRLVDLLEQFGMYRQQREVEVSLNVSLAVLGEVRAGLALPSRVLADGAASTTPKSCPAARRETSSCSIPAIRWPTARGPSRSDAVDQRATTCAS